MADINKAGKPTLITQTPPTTAQTPDLVAGEDIDYGDACYIKASDGKVYRSNGTAANAAAECDGFASKKYRAGEPMVLWHGVEFGYGSNLTAGAGYYVSTTPGALSDVATTGGTKVVAIAKGKDRVRVGTSRPL